jgi:folate-binding protein YgfZ
MMLTSFPRSGQPALADIEGRSIVMHYGDTIGEYGALRTGALLLDRSDRGRLRFTGARAAEVLTGLLTNDTTALTPGQGQYAAALTPKGKMVTDVRVFAFADSVLTDAPARGFPGWREVVRKHVNPRLVSYQDESEALVDVGLYGMHARRMMATLTGMPANTLAALAPYAHATVEIAGGQVVVARVPDLEIEGYEFLAPADARDALWRALVAAGAVPAGLAAWEIARIEAGRPEYGIEVDDATIPQEANFDELHAISYTKGCYTGQETVARVHFRGHVNRHLRGLRFLTAELPPAHAQLYDDAGKLVGDVRSAVLSPRLGAIGLAMVRREVVPSSTLIARWEAGECPATVLTLPFPL